MSVFFPQSVFPPPKLAWWSRSDSASRIDVPPKLSSREVGMLPGPNASASALGSGHAVDAGFCPSAEEKAPMRSIRDGRPDLMQVRGGSRVEEGKIGTPIVQNPPQPGAEASEIRRSRTNRMQWQSRPLPINRRSQDNQGSALDLALGMTVRCARAVVEQTLAGVGRLFKFCISGRRGVVGWSADRRKRRQVVNMLAVSAR
ncbi:hypothetical protein CPLU01_01515 [Colletotrichum plurivorum]|uniref:Uncharacterized protein n=1 Tax=Colletotrichum plurivorum TaxID=2175906 RepID=A0A8H6NP17_9PEZI|nr:hypothetical protein CPLU01_01515 [Colletotrichum plurivorum]